MTIRVILLVAACLAFPGCARSEQTSSFEQQVKHVAAQMTENADAPGLKMFATLLLASSPRSAFTLSDPGTQPVTADRNALVKMPTDPDALKSSLQVDPSHALKVLAKHLLAFNPPVKSIFSNRSPAQPRTKRSSTPLMVNKRPRSQMVREVLSGSGQMGGSADGRNFRWADPIRPWGRRMGGWSDGRMGGWSGERMGGWSDGRMGGWADGQMGRWSDGRIGGWAGEQMGGWAGERMGGWADGRMGGLADERMGRWSDVESFQNQKTRIAKLEAQVATLQQEQQEQPSQIAQSPVFVPSPKQVQANNMQQGQPIQTAQPPMFVPSSTQGQANNMQQVQSVQTAQPPMFVPSPTQVQANNMQQGQPIQTAQPPMFVPSPTQGQAKNISQIDGSFQIESAGPVRKSINKSDFVRVQGGSLKTWSDETGFAGRVQVVLSTDGGPLDANVELWQGPDNAPCQMRVYSEDGSTRPFSAVIANPYGGASTVAIRNVGGISFPLAAHVTANNVDEPINDFRETSVIVQGGSCRTYEFDPFVESVEIMLKTDGRPLNARVELLQGPSNDKQVIELYTEDGLDYPFFAIIDGINTMGAGNVVRVVNIAPMAFPMFASVQPRNINEKAFTARPAARQEFRVNSPDMGKF